MCVCVCPGSYYKAGLMVLKEVGEEIDPLCKLLGGSPEKKCVCKVGGYSYGEGGYSIF